MASSALVAGSAGNAYLWAGLAALFAGLALGAAVRWLRAARPSGAAGGAGGAGRRGRRPVGPLCLSLSLSVLALTALLVWGPPAFWRADYFFPWASLCLLLGLSLALAPLFLGLPALALLLAAELLFLDALRGWTPLEGPTELASYLPLVVEGGRCSGELSLPQGEGKAAARKLDLASGEAALSVERLELKGPALLLGHRGYYRLLGLEGKGGAELAAFPVRRSLLDALLPLDARGESRSLLARRWRESSPLVPLLPLSRLDFSFEGGGADLKLVVSQK